MEEKEWEEKDLLIITLEQLVLISVFYNCPRIQPILHKVVFMFINNMAFKNSLTAQLLVFLSQFH
jgi:hypothetical protein